MPDIRVMTYVAQTLHAPFDKEQLAALKKRQANENTSRYICIEHGSNGRFVLEATIDGLKCPECGNNQPWMTREVHDDKKKKPVMTQAKAKAAKEAQAALIAIEPKDKADAPKSE